MVSALGPAPLSKLLPATLVEPATPGLEGRCPIQLSSGRKSLVLLVPTRPTTSTANLIGVAAGSYEEEESLLQ
jgi:hypothetical protein